MTITIPTALQIGIRIIPLPCETPATLVGSVAAYQKDPLDLSSLTFTILALGIGTMLGAQIALQYESRGLRRLARTVPALVACVAIATSLMLSITGLIWPPPDNDTLARIEQLEALILNKDGASPLPPSSE